MIANVLEFSIEFNHATDCITCGVPIVMSKKLERQKRDDHSNYYCVNGHSQYWTAKSDVEILREKLAEKDRQLVFERERAATNFAAREKAEREALRLKRRIRGGACPCCKRSFTNLRRHMTTKHPDFAKDEQ